ncbi:MAG TPA: hypothetical protein VHG91_10945 [Longimicrobium sp.]|nr:hypothetical protein [Longimicrobium sp.]
MIDLGDTRAPVPPDVLRAPGGFAWWYADLVTPGGDGAVLIWSYGLPFLPGYASAARRGAGELPASRPSVNLAVYRGGAPAFYLLQEHAPAPEGEGRPAGVQEIGGCRFVRTFDGRYCTLGADLDLALPGTRARLTGTFRLRGVARLSPESGPAADAPHLWTPMTGPAEGEVRLEVGGCPFVELAGRAYHDRNHGRVPLHDLGIARWMWGRVPLARTERIYYLLWPSSSAARPVCLGVEIGEDGETRRVEVEAELVRERRGLSGVARPERILLRAGRRPWLIVDHARTVEAGPFYLRLLSRGTTGEGESALGWSELCVPDRVDLPLHRPLVRMRVHRAQGPNSRWLPLFTGPREGRVGRLLRHFLAPG